jgi:hypothetical protein
MSTASLGDVKTVQAAVLALRSLAVRQTAATVQLNRLQGSLAALLEVEEVRPLTMLETTSRTNLMNQVALATAKLQQILFDKESLLSRMVPRVQRQSQPSIDWVSYLSPALDVEPTRPHARYIAKWAPLSYVIGQLQSKEGQSFVRSEIRTTEAQLREAQTKAQLLLDTRLKPAESERNAAVADLDNLQVALQAMRNVQSSDFPKKIEQQLEQKRLAVQKLRETIDLLHREYADLNESAKEKMRNVTTNFRALLSPFLLPLQYVQNIAIWAEEPGATEPWKCLNTYRPATDLDGFWLGFALLTKFGEHLKAIVIETNDGASYETIYPLQTSILQTLSGEDDKLPLTDEILNRVRKLPQENANPDLWQIITTAFTKEFECTFWNLAGTSRLSAEKGARRDAINGVKIADYWYRASQIIVSTERGGDRPYTIGDILENRAHTDFEKANLVMMARYTVPNISDFETTGLFCRLDVSSQHVADVEQLIRADNMKTVQTPAQTTMSAWSQSGLGDVSATIYLASQPQQRTFALWLRVPRIVPSVWVRGRNYPAGAVVSYRFSNFVATRQTDQQPPSAPSSGWQPRPTPPGETEDLPCLAQVKPNSVDIVAVRPIISPASARRWPCMWWSAEQEIKMQTDDADAKRRKENYESKVDRLRLESDPRWAVFVRDATSARADSRPLSGWTAEAHFVSTSGGCQIIANGAIITNTHKLLSELFDVDYLELDDLASGNCAGTNTKTLLRASNAFKEGSPWYTRFGFVPRTEDVRDALVFINEVVRALPFDRFRTWMLQAIMKQEIDKRAPMLQVMEAFSCAAQCSADGCPAKTSWTEAIDAATRQSCNNLSRFVSLFENETYVNALLDIIQSALAQESAQARQKLSENADAKQRSIAKSRLDFRYDRLFRAIRDARNNVPEISNYFSSGKLANLAWLRRYPRPATAATTSTAATDSTAAPGSAVTTASASTQPALAAPVVSTSTPMTGGAATHSQQVVPSTLTHRASRDPTVVAAPPAFPFTSHQLSIRQPLYHRFRVRLP